MLMPPIVQWSLFLGSLAAFALLGATLRSRRTWPALLLWLAPVGLALPLADWATAGLGALVPAFRMDGQPGDGWRFSAVLFVVLCSVEISTQLFLTAAARTRAVHRPAGPPAAPAAPASPAESPPDPAPA